MDEKDQKSGNGDGVIPGQTTITSSGGIAMAPVTSGSQANVKLVEKPRNPLYVPEPKPAAPEEEQTGREYVVLERQLMVDFVMAALAGAGVALEDDAVKALHDAGRQVFVEIERSKAHNADRLLKLVGERLARNTNVVCIPTSSFVEKPVTVTTKVEVHVG